MSPVEAVRSVLSNYFNFSGRAARSEFWWWVAAWTLGWIIAAALLTVDPAVGISAIGLYWLVTLIPYLAVTVRRLHDSGRTGWWLLIGVIPFGGLLLLVFMVMETEPVNNQWGPPATIGPDEEPSWGSPPS